MRYSSIEMGALGFSFMFKKYLICFVLKIIDNFPSILFILLLNNCLVKFPFVKIFR